MARNTLTKPAMAPKLIKSFVRRVSDDPDVHVVQVSVNNERRIVTTLIDDEPFKSEPRYRVYDAQHETLRNWPEDEPPYEFRLFNLGDHESEVRRNELLQHPEAEVLYQRQ